MGNYLVVSVKDSKVVDSFETELDAWCFIGEREHKLCVEYPCMSYEEAAKFVQSVYRIYAAI